MATQQEIDEVKERLNAIQQKKQTTKSGPVGSVDQVRDRLNKISAEKIEPTTPTASTETAKKPSAFSGVEKVEQVAIGAGKGVISTIKGAAELGERGLAGALRTILPKSAEKKLGLEKGLQETAASQVIPEELTQTENKLQKAGFIGEQILEFFIPGGASTKISKVSKVMAKARGFSNLATKAIGLGTRAVSESVLAGGQTALQKGKIDKEVKLATGLGAAIPIGLAGAKVLTKGLGKGLAAGLGKSTGTSASTIVESFKNSNVVKFAREAGKDVTAFTDDIFNSVKSGLNSLRNIRAKDYQKSLAKIKLNNTQLDNITGGVRTKAVDLLEQFDIKITPPGERVGGNLLDFSNSTIVKGQDVVQKALNDVMRWVDNTPVGLDKLKRRLFQFGDQLSSRENKQAKLIVQDLAHSVDSGLKKNVKGYENMTSGYRKASELINEIERTLSIGGKKSKETGLKKILTSLRTNNEQRKELLSILDPQGKNDIVGRVAGAQLAEVLPRGLSGVFTPLAGGAIGVLNPSFIPQILALVALSSPRIVAELTNVLGRVTGQMIKVNKFSPEIQKVLREIIIKTKKE